MVNIKYIMIYTNQRDPDAKVFDNRRDDYICQDEIVYPFHDHPDINVWI